MTAIIEIPRRDIRAKRIKGKELKKDCERLKERARKFVSLFQLEGFGKGTFEEVEKVFQKAKFDLGRGEVSSRVALENGMDYAGDAGGRAGGESSRLCG